MKPAAPKRRLPAPAPATRTVGPPRRCGPLRHRHTLVATLSLVVATLSGASADLPVEEPFKVGFGSNLFTDVNENDAKASVRAWGQSVARELKVPVTPEPLVLHDIEQMVKSFQTHTMDAAGMTTPDYDLARRRVDLAPIFVTRIGQQITERYLLLVHQKGPVKTLADLKGSRLIVHAVSRTCLAPLWLDTRLIASGLEPAAKITPRRTEVTKVSKAVLPVFFQQAEACLVTQNGFSVMSDLNPQVGKQLVALESSPDLVPAVFALRSDFAPTYRDRLIQGIKELGHSPAGRQILTVFQGEELIEVPPKCLDETLSLLATHARAFGIPVPPPPPVGTPSLSGSAAVPR